MPTPIFGDLPQMNTQSASLEELRSYVGKLQNHLVKLQRDLGYLLGSLDYENIFAVGGWRVNPDEIVSKDGDVGMSTVDTAADDIRFWAGDVKTGTPKFYVTKGGILYAVDGVFQGTITADAGQIGGFTITATALTAISGGTIQSAASGARTSMDNTGFHAYDSAGVERITIGTATAEGPRALVGRDSLGAAQSVNTYDTETVDGSSRTGQFITAHGSYVLIENNGHIRIQDGGEWGLRAAGTRPELNDGFGWSSIAKLSEVNAKQDSFIGLTGSFTFVESVDFGASTVVTKTATLVNGVITAIA